MALSRYSAIPLCMAPRALRGIAVVVLARPRVRRLASSPLLNTPAANESRRRGRHQTRNRFVQRRPAPGSVCSGPRASNTSMSYRRREVSQHRRPGSCPSAIARTTPCPATPPARVRTLKHHSRRTRPASWRYTTSTAVHAEPPKTLSSDRSTPSELKSQTRRWVAARRSPHRRTPWRPQRLHGGAEPRRQDYSPRGRPASASAEAALREAEPIVRGGSDQYQDAPLPRRVDGAGLLIRDRPVEVAKLRSTQRKPQSTAAQGPPNPALAARHTNAIVGCQRPALGATPLIPALDQPQTVCGRRALRSAADHDERAMLRLPALIDRVPAETGQPLAPKFSHSTVWKSSDAVAKRSASA